MPDLLQRGAAWLADQRRRHLSRTVTYVRGLDSVDLPATVGRSTFEQVDEHGVLQRTEADDFLISPADLVLDGQRVLPEAGDRIREATDGGGTRVYEVLAIGTEPPWRWSDPHRTTLRIHTKVIGTEA